MTNLEIQIKLDEFKPRDYQKPLFDAFINKGYKKLMCIWPRRCLPGATKILMASSLDGERRSEYKCLKDIKAGDKVVSCDFSKNLYTPAPFVEDTVKNIWHTGVKEILKIKLCYGYEILTSYDHVFAIMQEDQSFSWITAGELTLKDILLFRSNINGCFMPSGIKSIHRSRKKTCYDIETENNHNFIADNFIVHNSGKDLAALQLLLYSALKRVGIYYMIYPTYNQAKKIIWDGMTNDSKKFLDYIPKELIENINSTEMKIILKNKSLIQLVGSSDAGDRIVGSNPVGVVFSEFALCDPACYHLCRPMLNANDGWAIILSTPRGHNALFQLFEVARQTPEWFVSKLTLDDTRHIPHELVEREVQTGEISRDLSLQEYWTSFSCGQSGSFYGTILDNMRLKGQISTVPYETHHLVSTSWDIGLDTTAIIFFQVIGATVRIIDYYENQNLSLDHYINVIKNKPYTYNKHVAPHDMANREFSSGISRLEMARRLDVRFTLAPNLSIMDGIEATRALLSRTFIDEISCSRLIHCIENYRQAYDEKKKTYTGVPFHDQWSHGSDALRMLSITLPKISTQTTPEALEQRYRDTIMGPNSSLPSIFRTDLPNY